MQKPNRTPLSNFTFGSASNTFEGRPGFFYKTYLIVGGVFALIGILSAIILGSFAPGLLQGSMNSATMLPVIAGSYFIFFIGAITVNLYVYVRLTNYCFENTSMGSIKAQSKMTFSSFLRLRLTNLIAIIFSFGLLIPWAKVRKQRYMTENISIMANTSLDTFTSSTDHSVSALGDSAADFFDMEVGI